MNNRNCVQLRLWDRWNLRNTEEKLEDHCQVRWHQGNQWLKTIEAIPLAFHRIPGSFDTVGMIILNLN